MTKEEQIEQLTADIKVFNDHYKLIISHNMLTNSIVKAVKDQDFEIAATLRDEKRSIEDELNSMQPAIQELSKKYDV